MDQQNADIVVAGTGPTGLTAALSLAQAGFAVALIGPPVAAHDRRTAALMIPALETLDRLGVGAGVRAASAPLEAMRIIDGTKRLIRSPPVTFRAQEIGEPYFGRNIANRELNVALEEAVTLQPGIVWLKSLVTEWRLDAASATAIMDTGESVEAKMAVAADGRLSPAREAAGISVPARRLPQSALVFNFAHSRPHANISTEFHTESGPFTQVPMKGDRSSLVWVVQPSVADELMAMDDGSLSRRAEETMQSLLGRITVEPGRQVYPLTASTAHRFARNRVALVGEAAHIFPPIGAQGLNLGLRDVMDLTATARKFSEDPGAAAALAHYEARRRPDILARSMAVNALNRTLLSDLLPAQLARRVGLSALEALAPLRALFMREGLRPGAGFAGLVGASRKQIRR